MKYKVMEYGNSIPRASLPSEEEAKKYAAILAKRENKPFEVKKEGWFSTFLG